MRNIFTKVSTNSQMGQFCQKIVFAMLWLQVRRFQSIQESLVFNTTVIIRTRLSYLADVRPK